MAKHDGKERLGQRLGKGWLAPKFLMYGEGIGLIRNKERTGISSWMFAAVARGPGDAAWGQVYSSDDDAYILGDKAASSPVGFGSMHPQSVNFSKADGSTWSVSRSISLNVFYAFCGRNDGFVIGEL